MLAGQFCRYPFFPDALKATSASGGKELRHPPLLPAWTINKKIFHKVGTLPSDERTTAAETSYFAIFGSQIGFYFDYAILGAALRTLERCGCCEHVWIMR